MQLHRVQAIQNQKSTGVVFLLFIFLGLFGAHRFYTSGVTVFNVVYALTCGFLGIMIIADFFLLWGMAKKSNDNAMVTATLLDHAMTC